MLMREMLHEVRVIHLDGRPHLPSSVRFWQGDSVGHWEGDTLVVDTTNYNDDVRFASFNCCGPAGAGMHIVERFRRVDENTIDFRYTVDDPSTYTRPWTVAVPMTRMNEPHLRVRLPRRQLRDGRHPEGRARRRSSRKKR